MELETWIEQIDDLSSALGSNLKYVLKEVLDESVPIAQNELIRFASDGNDNADIVYSIDGERGNYTAEISLVGEDAEYVEYGYGAIAEGSYPEGDPWEYDINGHGMKGWYYAHGKKSYGQVAGAVIYYLTRDLSDSLDSADEIVARHRRK